MMKRLLLFMFTLLTGMGAWAQYPVWIGNTQLTSEYLGELESSGYRVTGFSAIEAGTMNYYPPTNKLTLHGVSLRMMNSVMAQAIKFSDTGILELDGTNTINTTNDCVSAAANLTIQGSGSLQCTSTMNCGIYVTNGATLAIDNCSVSAQGHWGISGNSTNERLIINHADVSATGNMAPNLSIQLGSICDFNYYGYGGGVQLTNASIAAPEGAKFNSSKTAVVDASGNVITETVFIRSNYYDEATGVFYGFKTVNGEMKAVVAGYEHGWLKADLVIPAAITIDGEDYEVTAIDVSAFSGCTQLEKVTIPETVTSIGSGAFYDCKNLIQVTMLNPTPLAIESTTFGLSSEAGNATYEKTLVVPIGSSWRYKNANYWKQFKYVQAYSIIGDCTYLEDGAGGAMLAAYQGSATAFAIPASITVGGVSYAVTTIDNMAFWYCSNLERVTIPSSVTSINYYAIYSSTLRAITVDSGNTVYDSREGCNAIIETATNTLIQGCPTTVIPSTVTSIRAGAFAGFEDALTSITIPASVASIGDYAFTGCKLTTVTVKAKVPPTLGKDVFDTDVYANATLKVLNATTYQMAAGWKDFQHFEWTQTITIGDFVFAYDSDIREAELMRYTGTAASVTIPKTISVEGVSHRVTSIGMMGLLSDLYVPNTTMQRVSIPSTVTVINPYAFYGCTALIGITVESGNTVYDSREGCNAIIETATNRLFQGCGMTVIPSTVTSIGDGAFSYTNLTSISIPANVKSIGMEAFNECRNLESVTLNYGLEQIGDYAFMGCDKLASVTIPLSVKNIGRAFLDSGLKQVVVPNSITTLDDYAFDLCDKLTTVTLPSTMTSIGTKAFRYCSSLRTIKVKATTPPAMGNSVFGEYDEDEFMDEFGIYTEATLYVPKGTMAAYRSANVWENFTHIEEFDDVIPGDVNGDSMVSISDVVAMVNYILGHSPENFNIEAADINNDETVSIADVVGIVNIILSSTP